MTDTNSGNHKLLNSKVRVKDVEMSATMPTF